MREWSPRAAPTDHVLLDDGQVAVATCTPQSFLVPRWRATRLAILRRSDGRGGRRVGRPFGLVGRLHRGHLRTISPAAEPRVCGLLERVFVFGSYVAGTSHGVGRSRGLQL